MTTDTFDWSPYLGTSSDRPKPPIWKADEEGKTVAGTVDEVWVYKKGDETTPVIHLTQDDGSPVSVWVSQVRLRDKIAEGNPQVGDRLAVRFDGVEKLESGNTLKLFSVKVTKNGASAAEFSEEPF